MGWTFNQLKPILRANWWWMLLVLAAVVVVLWILGQGWALVVFSAALVLATVALVLETAALARANDSLARSQIRAELRAALLAARKFIEINPDSFATVLKNRPIPHTDFNAIDELAFHTNGFHDWSIAKDVQAFANQIDMVKTGVQWPEAGLGGMTATLKKLQERVVSEMLRMRQDLRDWTTEAPGGRSKQPPP